MISRDNCIEAIAKCTAYDPMHSPRQSELIANAWAEHFAMFPALTRTELLTAVTEYYRTPQRPWPQPADISNIARARRRDLADHAPVSQLTESSPASVEQRETHMARINQILAKQRRRWSLS